MRRNYVSKEGQQALCQSTIAFEAIQAVYLSFGSKYEQILFDSSREHLAMACAGILAYGDHLSEAITQCYENNLGGIGESLLRVSLENTANLLYILYAGPVRDSKTQDTLAKQFLKFGDLQHKKMVDRTVEFKDVTESAIFSRLINDPRFPRLKQAVENKATAIKTEFPEIGKMRWHQMAFEDMTVHVQNHLPSFVDKEFWAIMRKASTKWNFGLHASSFMFTRNKPKSQRTRLRHQYLSANYSGAAAMFSMFNWYALADTFGDLQEIQNAFTGEVERLGER